MNIHSRMLRCRAQYIESQQESPMYCNLGSTEMDELREWLNTTPREVKTLIGSIVGGMMVLPTGNERGIKCT